MSLEQAIGDLKERILAVSPDAEIRVEHKAEDEAVIRAYAPADHESAIKEATREKAFQFFEKDQLHLQVIFYDVATDRPPDELPTE
jgi:hypothetical protein